MIIVCVTQLSRVLITELSCIKYRRHKDDLDCDLMNGSSVMLQKFDIEFYNMYHVSKHEALTRSSLTSKSEFINLKICFLIVQY